MQNRRPRMHGSASLPKPAPSQLGEQEFVDRFVAKRSRRLALLRILEDFSFIVPNHDFFLIVKQNVPRINRHLASTAGSVDHKLRNGIPRGMAAESFNNLDAFRDRST